MKTEINCPECAGFGITNYGACGDPECCGVSEKCDNCNGTGVILTDTDTKGDL